MRHRFATDLLERGANIKVVQELLGHENLATTEIYLSVTNQSLKDAVNLLDKKNLRVTPKKRARKEEINTLMKSIEALDRIMRRRKVKKRNIQRQIGGPYEVAMP